MACVTLVRKVDQGCAGYNVVFGFYWHEGNNNLPKNATYLLWATNPADTTTPLSDQLSFPVSVLTSPVPPPYSPLSAALPSTSFSITIDVFAEVGFTAQGDTHVHVVLNTYPPRMDYVGFIDDLTCDSQPIASQYQPSQFEHVFDTVDGKLHSRYNLSWMIGGKVCSVIGYSAVMSSSDSGYGRLTGRKIVPQIIN